MITNESSPRVEKYMPLVLWAQTYTPHLTDFFFSRIAVLVGCWSFVIKDRYCRSSQPISKTVVVNFRYPYLRQVSQSQWKWSVLSCYPPIDILVGFTYPLVTILISERTKRLASDNRSVRGCDRGTFLAGWGTTPMTFRKGLAICYHLWLNLVLYEIENVDIYFIWGLGEMI